MTSNETISSVVLAELARRGMTRAQLARLLDVPPQYVTHKLNGWRRWSVDDLDLLSERLGIPVAWLLIPPREEGGERAPAASVTERYPWWLRMRDGRHIRSAESRCRSRQLDTVASLLGISVQAAA